MWILFLDYQALEGWKEHITRNVKRVSEDHPAMEKKKKRAAVYYFACFAGFPISSCLLQRNQMKTK